VVGVLRFVLKNEQVSGPYNLIAPEPISNADFYKALAKAMHRPYWFPTPAFLLRLVLGEMSVLVVDGRYAQPKRLLEAGYGFKVANIDEAMKRLVK
jgi:NAD dependent epimerase/dehydratase family enzyme